MDIGHEILNNHECCSHVGALLFFLNYVLQKEEISVASKMAYRVHSENSNKIASKQLSEVNLAAKYIIENNTAKTNEIELKINSSPIMNTKQMLIIFNC